MQKRSRSARRTVRVEDVAREAGVSPITVSRALSTPDKVRPETRKKVEAAVARTGYVVNRYASSLRSGRSTLIPVFVPSLQSAHIARALQGCIEALEGSRYHLLMAQTGSSAASQGQMLAEMLPFRPAALVFTGMSPTGVLRRQVAGLGIPVLEFGETDDEPLDMTVGLNNAEAGRLMGLHFRERRFGRIAFAGRLGGAMSRRLEGFAEGFGRDFDLVLPLDSDVGTNDGMAAFLAIRKALPDCDAMLFGTDLLAVGAMLQARKSGVAVPAQVAIAGHGDFEYAPHIDPPLTTVHLSSQELGRLAGDMLRKRLAGETLASHHVVAPVRLETRGSTRR